MKMKNKNVLLYSLIIIAIAYLIYHSLTTNYGFGMMMYHHYGYYDNYSITQYYLKSIGVFISYGVILFSVIVLLQRKSRRPNSYLRILNQRLSNGDINIDDYNTIKHIIESGK